MFSLLLTLSLSEKLITWEWVKQRPYNVRPPFPDVIRDFTIYYKGHQTSWTKELGWYVKVSVDDRPHLYITGINEGKADIRFLKLKFWTEFSFPFKNNENYLLIQFFVKNYGTEPHYIAIDSRIDWFSSYFDSEFSPSTTREGNQGDGRFTIKNNPHGLTYRLITRDGYGVTNVDDFWYHGLKPVIRGATEEEVIFAWNNKAIYPNETKVFGVLLGIGDLNLKNPPKITLKTQLNQLNMPNKEITVIVNVFEIDAGERVTLYYNFNGKTNEAGHLDSGNGNTNKDFAFTVRLGSEINRYPLEIWAEDTANLKSNVIDFNLLVNEAPYLEIVDFNNLYAKNMALEVQGRVWDDTIAHITYQIDNQLPIDIKGDYVCNRAMLNFGISYRVNDKDISNGEHTIKFWATDEFGAKSVMRSSKFKYDAYRTTPEIKVNQCESFMNNPGTEYEFLVLKGQARDFNYNGIYNIKFSLGQDSDLKIFLDGETKISNPEWVDFLIYGGVPRDFPAKFKIPFKVVDQLGVSSLWDYFDSDFNCEKTSVESKTTAETNIPTIANTISPTHVIESTITTFDLESTVTTYDIELTDTTYINASIQYPIITDIAISTTTQSQISKNSNVYIINPPYKKEDTNVIDNIWPFIVGIVSGVVLIITIAIAAIIIYHEAKKKAHKFNENGEVIPENEDSEDEDPTSSKKYIFEGEERSEYGVII